MNWRIDNLYLEASKLERELAEVTEQRDRLAEALREMLKSTPRSLQCEDFHHPKADQRHGDICPPTKRFRDAWDKSEKALAAFKGKKYNAQKHESHYPQRQAHRPP